LPNSGLFIIATKRYGSDRVFGQIGREFQLAVLQKAGELIPTFEQIVAAFG
jgi:hypothetical protein